MRCRTKLLGCVSGLQCVLLDSHFCQEPFKIYLLNKVFFYLRTWLAYLLTTFWVTRFQNSVDSWSNDWGTNILYRPNRWGQITLELYLFGSRGNIRRLGELMTIWLKRPICTYHRVPTPKDPVSTTFIFASSSLLKNPSSWSKFTRQTAMTYKSYNRPRKLSARQPRSPSYHSTGDHLAHREKFLTKMHLNMATACDPRSTWYCFVIGSSRDLLVAVVSPDAVKTMGRRSPYFRDIGVRLTKFP